MATLEDSKIQFRSVVALVGAILTLSAAVVGGVWKISSVLNEYGNKLTALTASLEEVKTNSYTLARASEQALRQAIENPTMRVPDPRDPAKLIVVYSAASGNGH